MHSGVGPADVLANASVLLVLELPGVGQHLQDHLMCTAYITTSYYLSLYRPQVSCGTSLLKRQEISPVLALVSLWDMFLS